MRRWTERASERRINCRMLGGRLRVAKLGLKIVLLVDGNLTCDVGEDTEKNFDSM